MHEHNLSWLEIQCSSSSSNLFPKNLPSPPPLPPTPFFGIWQSVSFFFRIWNFRHLADYQNNFRSSVGKFVIWLPIDFFVKRQRNFRQKAALPIKTHSLVFKVFFTRIRNEMFAKCTRYLRQPAQFPARREKIKKAFQTFQNFAIKLKKNLVQCEQV